MAEPSPKVIDDNRWTADRKFGAMVFLVWAVVTLYMCMRVVNFVILCQLYGRSQVWTEHLHFTSAPKFGLWVVSNGVQTANQETFVHYLSTLAVWSPMRPENSLVLTEQNITSPPPLRGVEFTRLWP